MFVKNKYLIKKAKNKPRVNEPKENRRSLKNIIPPILKENCGVRTHRRSNKQVTTSAQERT